MSPGTHLDLDKFLLRIDGMNYGEYKKLKSQYTWTEGLAITLYVDSVQGDPFASPSCFRAQIPLSETGIPESIYSNHTRTIAFCDYVNRRVVSLVKQWRLDEADTDGNYHGPKGGNFDIYKPEQQILERSSCVINNWGSEPTLEIRFAVTLPAYARTINGQKAHELLTTHLPKLIESGFLWKHQDQQKVLTHLRTAEVQEALRSKLAEKGLVAFVGNDAILPRISGANPEPMGDGAIPFQSPKDMEITIDTGILNDAGQPISITGMGIPRGVVVITGGGFHGKSTLLEALQFGIYNVIPGDGRELVVTEPNAFKIRAEDGRNIVSTDITPFIDKLPGKKITSSFSTEDASGSTSMAANIQEALEVGATVLIIDEDTSATNLLVRDNKMHELVLAEPITPLVSKVEALYSERDVSTIIVIGGCGDYLEPANLVIGMDSYVPHNWTDRARTIAAKYPNATTSSPNYGTVSTRTISLPPLGHKSPRAKGTDKIAIMGNRFKVTGQDNLPGDISIGAIEQLVEEGQTNMCIEALRHIEKNPPKTILDWAVELSTLTHQHGVNIRNDAKPSGKIAMARPLEILAVVNRIRGLRVIADAASPPPPPSPSSSFQPEVSS